MNCLDSAQSHNITDTIIDATESIILDSSSVSFSHSKLIRDNICSARKYYDFFSSREDILICMLLRRTVAHDICEFIKRNEKISILEKLLLPTIMSYEVASKDQVYLKACLMTTNVGVWQTASAPKQKLLKKAEELYFSSIKNAIDESVAAGIVTTSNSDNLAKNIYYHIMGRLLALGNTLFFGEELSYDDDLDVFLSMLGILDKVNDVDRGKITDLKKKVAHYVDNHRSASCRNCKEHYYCNGNCDD